MFSDTVKDTQNLDASAFKTSRLKAKLEERFPQLTFLRASRRNESDIVFAKDIELGEVVEQTADSIQTSSSESDSSTGSEDEGNEDKVSFIDHTNTRTLFHAAQILQHVVENWKSTTTAWPPTAADLNLDTARRAILPLLFNFLAWLVGASVDPETSAFVPVQAEEERRLLSISQDLVYLSAKGRVVLPKHTALAMTVRHMTGSARLIGILNGYGHCVSHSMVLEHDTALAEKQLAKVENPLPDGVQLSCFTTLVWDNNDFGEKTLSGKGTTHNTNGIIIQRSRPNPIEQHNSIPPKTLPRSHKRSIKPPPTEVTPYFGTMKEGPDPYGKDVDVRKETYYQLQQAARHSDLTFCLSRMANPTVCMLPKLDWLQYHFVFKHFTSEQHLLPKIIMYQVFRK